MSDYRRFDDAVWDRFFEFLDATEEPTSMSEVDDELARRGLDVAPTVRRVLDSVHAAQARAALERARKKRPTVLKRLSSVVGPDAASLRDRLREIVNQQLEGTLQAAFFRKLEQAASDRDLRTLLEDIERLSVLGQDDSNDED